MMKSCRFCWAAAATIVFTASSAVAAPDARTVAAIDRGLEFVIGEQKHDPEKKSNDCGFG